MKSNDMIGWRVVSGRRDKSGGRVMSGRRDMSGRSVVSGRRAVTNILYRQFYLYAEILKNTTLFQ